MTLRTCSKCAEQHPIEFFNRDRTRPDGRYSQCKNCSRAAVTRVYRQDHERRLEKNRAWKAENAERHAEINRAYQKANPEKGRAAQSRWRANNPEKAREWAAKNPEKVRDLTRKWKTANRAKVLETERAWIAKNRGKVRAHCANRRARLSKATPVWADHEMLAFIYAEAPSGWHVDHIYPLKGRNSCGLHVPWNLQYLPAAVNSAKSNKVPVAQEAW